MDWVSEVQEICGVGKASMWTAAEWDSIELRTG